MSIIEAVERYRVVSQQSGDDAAPSNSRLLILGNGPSLKQEFFPLFYHFPCLGMNAAYRYWERIDWYPDYYLCLDREVVVSHSAKIRQMIEQRRCRRFLLQQNFLRAHPDLLGHPDVVYLPQLLPGEKAAQECADLGIAHSPSEFFSTSNPIKLTTGGYAPRFARYLGYTAVGLIGIDLRYVEMIPEAEVVRGIVLQIKETPKKNPNYFFSDYQVAGDRYNVPNPKGVQADLHFEAFEVLKSDNENFGFGLDLVVCTRESRLFESRLFPYVPIEAYVRGRAASMRSALPASGGGHNSPVAGQAPLLVYIDCDATDAWGHYLAYALHIKRAAEEAGMEVLIFGNRGLESGLQSRFEGVFRPVFTNHSRFRDEGHIKCFGKELKSALASLPLSASRQVLLYMYTGSFEHAEAIARIVKTHPGVRVNVNLFYAHDLDEGNKSVVSRWRPLLQHAGEKEGLMFTVPTNRLQRDFENAFGVQLPVAPHPSCTFSDKTVRSLEASGEHRSNKGVTVLFPGGLQVAKGFELTFGAASTLVISHRLECIVRAAIRPETGDRLKELAGELADLGVEVVGGVFDENEFQRFLAKGDILVCPYLPSFFARRTSGLVVDAILLGRPFVALKNTWLGEFAESTRAGLAVDASPVDIVSAVLRIVRDYSEYSARAASARRDYISRHSWDSLIGSIAGKPGCAQTWLVPVARQPVVVGPYTREQSAHWDETSAIAEFFLKQQGGIDKTGTMVDVGAHHGSAFRPFLDVGWSIYAFEPDKMNRTKLLERLNKHKNKALVSLDTRCVSNQSQTGVSFFTSEQSTGISGLSAFHKTHRESQKVDITTLAEFFEDRPMPVIDFLKIDTEGHDLFVLQGYPWERGEPAVIECEFEDTKTVPLGYTFHDLARYLVDKGYRVYVSEWHPIIRYGIRHDWRALMRYPCELADPGGWGNLLAFRDPLDEQALVAAAKEVLKLGTTAPTQAPASATLPTAPVPIGQPNLRVAPGPHYVLIAPNQWRYTHSEAKQRLWVASLTQSIAAGQVMTGGLRIQGDRAMTVNVTLGRHGSTAWEGTTQRLELVPGQAQVVALTKSFEQPHAALKLQVEVGALPDGGSASLTITNLHLTETPESLIRRLGLSNITLAEANRRLRAGDLATALPMYLWLYDQRPMSIYADNALSTARKSGLGKFNTIAELRERMAG